MKTHEIIVCTNTETIRPYNIDADTQDAYYSCADDVVEEVLRKFDRDIRIDVDTDSDFRNWNGGKYSWQRYQSDWCGGSGYVVCKNDAPKYVQAFCKKLDNTIQSALVALIDNLKAENAALEAEEAEQENE